MQKKNLIRTNPIKTVELLFLKIPALNSFQISHDSDNFDSVVSHAEEAKSALNILAFTSDYYIYIHSAIFFMDLLSNRRLRNSYFSVTLKICISTFFVKKCNFTFLSEMYNSLQLHLFLNYGYIFLS
jgi:hypothetical protein